MGVPLMWFQACPKLKFYFKADQVVVMDFAKSINKSYTALLAIDM